MEPQISTRCDSKWSRITIQEILSPMPYTFDAFHIETEFGNPPSSNTDYFIFDSISHPFTCYCENFHVLHYDRNHVYFAIYFSFSFNSRTTEVKIIEF